MSAKRNPRALALTTTILTLALIAGVLSGVAQAVPLPVKLELTGHITGAFEEYPDSVAVDNDPGSVGYGEVYVADSGEHRVQVFTAAGVFVSMFGWDVNATKEADPAATQAEKNVCTAKSEDVCQAGAAGTAAGQVSQVYSIAVDPVSGDVYSAEYVFGEEGFGLRVQKFTAEGHFLLEIGRGVNATKKTNLCSEEEAEKEGVQCGAPGEPEAGSSEHGAFDFHEERGNLLVAGGKEDLLYVGDEHRIQEFKANGEPAGDISLEGISAEPASKVQALALDQETGDLYTIYPSGNTIHELNPEGTQIASYPVNALKPSEEVAVFGLAADSKGHLAVAAASERGYFGVVYDAANGQRVSGFTIPPSAAPIKGIAFDSQGDLYAAGPNSASEVEVYTAQPAAELQLGAASCKEGLGAEASVVFACTLGGEANPEGVAETEALFQWGYTPTLGETTPAQAIASTQPVQAVVDVRPNGTFYYRLAAYNHDVKAPEQVETAQGSQLLPGVPPRIVGAPSVQFASSTSAVLTGELNPENANTTYQFLYAKACQPSETCPPLPQTPGVMSTESQQSSVYGGLGAEAEVSGLQPDTSYRYQLTASSELGAALNETGGTTLPEATFTTAPAPAPQASSGTASAIGATTATITGSINPDGVPTTYTFELGVYEGPSTQYGIVRSATAGTATSPIEETLQLTGLQPGETYAFRITAHSGYLHNSENTIQGASVLFTTSSLPPTVLAPTPLAQLPVPSIAFPGAVKPSAKVKHKSKTKHRKKKKKTRHHNTR